MFICDIIYLSKFISITKEINDMSETKRTRRTTEEIVAEFDKKIEYHKNCILQLETKKENALKPKTRANRLTLKKITEFAKSQGMSLEEIAEKLGYALPTE